MGKDIIITEKFIGIVDEPNPKGSEDTLDIYRHADALTTFIRNTGTPMTIGIQGEWGSGKTSLLNAIYYSLEKEGGKFFIMDLLRPNSVDAAAALVETYASNESAQLKEDFYNSLLAAYNLNEIEEQLQENSILDFNIQQITDRHFIVFGSMFA